MNTKVGRGHMEVRRPSNGSAAGSADRGPHFSLETWLELQRLRIARVPAMTAAAVPDQPFRWSDRPQEPQTRRQKRQARDKARRAQLRHEAQLAYARSQMGRE